MDAVAVDHLAAWDDLTARQTEDGMIPIMRMPFEKLMELVAAISPEEKELPLGVFAGRWGEPAERIADAVTAVRVTQGERTYISVTAAD